MLTTDYLLGALSFSVVAVALRTLTNSLGLSLVGGNFGVACLIALAVVVLRLSRTGAEPPPLVGLRLGALFAAGVIVVNSVFLALSDSLGLSWLAAFLTSAVALVLTPFLWRVVWPEVAKDRERAA